MTHYSHKSSPGKV